MNLKEYMKDWHIKEIDKEQAFEEGKLYVLMELGAFFNSMLTRQDARILLERIEKLGEL